MKRHWTLAIAGLCTLAACQPNGMGSKNSVSFGPPVATVDGQSIGRDLYEFYVKSVTGKASSELTPEQRNQALDNLTRAHVIAAQAHKEGLATQTDTAALIELQRLNILQQALSEKYLKDKQPTEKELRAEYETQVAAMPRQEYRARHILVATEQFADKLVRELKRGAKFEDVARRESMDGSKENGGDLGWFTPDRMVKPFADAVVALKPGEFTQTPIQTPYGWHIIRLEETRELEPPTYDSVKQRLEQVILARKFRDYVDGLMKTAKVDNRLEPAPAPAAGDSAAKAEGETK